MISIYSLCKRIYVVFKILSHCRITPLPTTTIISNAPNLQPKAPAPAEDAGVGVVACAACPKRIDTCEQSLCRSHSWLSYVYAISVCYVLFPRQPMMWRRGAREVGRRGRRRGKRRRKRRRRVKVMMMMMFRSRLVKSRQCPWHTPGLPAIPG